MDDDIKEKFKSHASRIADLEQFQRQQQTAQAVEAEKRKYLDVRFNSIEHKLDTNIQAIQESQQSSIAEIKKEQEKIAGYFAKLAWLLAITIIGAVMKFIIAGGVAQ